MSKIAGVWRFIGEARNTPAILTILGACCIVGSFIVPPLIESAPVFLVGAMLANLIRSEAQTHPSDQL